MNSDAKGPSSSLTIHKPAGMTRYRRIPVSRVHIPRPHLAAGIMGSSQHNFATQIRQCPPVVTEFQPSRRSRAAFAFHSHPLSIPRKHLLEKHFAADDLPVGEKEDNLRRARRVPH